MTDEKGKDSGGVIMQVSKAFQSISNPLTSVGLLLEAVKRELDELQLRIDDPGVTRARVAAREMGKSLESLQLMARQAANLQRETDTPCNVDVNEALEFALQLAGHDLRARATTITSFGAPPPIYGSMSKLSQAFVNLLLQTAQAIPSGRPQSALVRVSTRRHHSGNAAVDIAITGPQVSQVDLPNAHNSVDDRVAESLGLSMCHRAVQELGGHMMIDCEPGAGAWFRIRLPASVS